MSTTAAEQPTLFEEPTKPVTCVRVCHLCGQPVCAIPLDDVSQPWMPAILWGHVEQKRHERQHHGEASS